MFRLLTSISTGELFKRQLPVFLVAFVIAELFYKFHQLHAGVRGIPRHLVRARRLVHLLTGRRVAAALPAVTKDSVMQIKDDRPRRCRAARSRHAREMSYQTDLLGRVLAEMKRANCQLGRSRATPATPERVAPPDGVQGCLLKLLAYQRGGGARGESRPRSFSTASTASTLPRSRAVSGGPPPCKHVLPEVTGWSTARASRSGRSAKASQGRAYPPVRREDNPARSRDTRPQRKWADRSVPGRPARSGSSDLRKAGSRRPGGSGLDFRVWDR